MNAARLLEYFDRIAEAPDAVSRLRKFILDLAVRGKLVEQYPDDEPAPELLKKILKQRRRLEEEGRVGRIKYLLPIDPSELPYGHSDVQLFSRLACLSSLQKGLTGIQGAKSGEYPLVVTASRRASCDHYDFEGAAAIVPMVSSAGHGRASINRLHYQEGQFAVGSILCAVFSVDEDLISARFIYEYLSAYKEELLVSKMVGTANVSLTLAKIAEVPVPLISPRSQSRLYELMGLCDQLEASQVQRERRRDRLVSASLKRIGQPEDVGNGEKFCDNVRFHLYHLPRLATRPEHVKELRQTILNLAVRGKLMPQKKNEATERSKLTKYVVEERKLFGFRQDIPSEDFGPLGIDFSKYNFPDSWEVMKLSEVALIIVDCPHSTPRWVESGVLCVRTNQFKPGFLDLTSSKYVSTETYIERIQRIEPKQDDILYSREGGILGVACRVPEDVKLCLGQRMMLFRMSSVYLSRFAEFVLNSSLITELARQKTTGGAAPRVNVALIKSYPMPVPPLAEQHRIVAKVDELMNLCDKLEVHLAADQTNQSRLLEATLCDALGVTCLPVKRPSRPAPSPQRVVATHSEQPAKPITPRPGPVETPTAAVQGRLIEQSTPQVGKPRAASGDIPGAILAQMRPGQEYSRAQLAEALDLSVYEWNMAIRELKESGRVVQTGEKRGARYSVSS